jgi:hypothetical protein
MVYDIQDYWVFGLCPSSGILKNRRTRFGNWICFRPQVRGQETPTQLGLLERASLNHCLLPPHLRMERDPVSKTLCPSVF